jgi:hypothetical protein
MRLRVALLALLCLALLAPASPAPPAPTPSAAEAQPSAPATRPEGPTGQAEAAPGVTQAPEQGSPPLPVEAAPDLVPVSEPTESPPAEAEPRRPAVVAFSLRYASRRPHAGEENLPAKDGVGAGLLLQGRYLTLFDRLELALAFDFGFERFSKTVSSSPSTLGSGPPPPTDEHLRQLTHTAFAILHPLTLHIGPIELMAAPGLGIDVSYFATAEPALTPGESRGTYLVLRGATSISWKLNARSALGLRADYASLPSAPTATLGADVYHVFAPRLGFGVTFLYRP